MVREHTIALPCLKLSLLGQRTVPLSLHSPPTIAFGCS